MVVGRAMAKERKTKAERRERRQVARDISYATSAATRGGRAMIRVMEGAGGRFGLIRRADGYDEEVRRGGDFWDIMVRRYGVRLDVVGGSLANIPSDGPIIVVANHPYGILDGLVLGHILARTRGDFRILAHRVFRKAEDLERIILPISFDESKEAMALNIATRKEALKYLSDGGAIGIFPGGTVSTSHKPFAKPMDPNWRSFTARMIAKSEARVVPIFFDGHNSRLFQLMSRMHSTLRMGMMIKEFRSRINTAVRLSIGQPIERAALEPYRSDARAMMDFLRRETYALSPEPINAAEIGFEFEEQHGGKARRIGY